MAKIPKILKTSHQLIEEQKEESYLGPHIPMSSLGHPCDRNIWLNFRWATRETFNARTLRIFDRGNLEEERVIKDLKAICCKVTNEQENVFGWERYPKGKIDGEVENLPESKKKHLLEIKTMNEKNFLILQRRGYKEGFPKYYVQAQLYMGYRELDRALIIVTNKNNEERYHERLRFDKTAFNNSHERARNIVCSENMPNKPSNCTAASFTCRYCKHGEICYAGAEPLKTCRTCVYCDLIGNAKFECSNKKFHEVLVEDIDLGYTNTLSNDRQKVGCKNYKKII